MLKIKKAIFKEICESLPEFYDYGEEALDDLMFKRKNNIRLSYKGSEMMKKIFDSYTVRLDKDKIRPKHLITLTRKFSCPYYMGRKYMVLFDDEDAMMMRLYGDPAQFISSME